MASKELIYKDDARRAILKANPSVAFCIDNIKAVDAKEVVHGKWIKGKYPGEYTCSRCGMVYCEADPKERPHKYCPECGSKNE